MRERFELPTVDATLAQMSGATVFSKLDANSGFYQIKIDETSSKFTTFITPFGRYFYKRLPMGISSAPEHYMRKMAQLVDSLDGTLCLMDDICVFGKNQKEHDDRLNQLLKILSNEGVTLNPDKCRFSVDKLHYLGYIVDKNGIRADPAKVEAIEGFAVPKNVKGIQRFLGMVNQLAKFVPYMSEKTRPLRELLNKNANWTWTEVHERSFSDLKRILRSADVLAHYDVNKPVVLSVDSSSYGIGAMLAQKTNSGLKPIAYASRSLNSAEQRYATIEKESLAVTWSCDHFEQYLVGRWFLIQTDHKPLIAILKTKHLHELSPRLQRFRLRILRFSYDLEYVPGKNNIVPDAMSRAPLICNQIEKCSNFLSVNELDDFCDMKLKSICISDIQLEKISKRR